MKMNSLIHINECDETEKSSTSGLAMNSMDDAIYEKLDKGTLVHFMNCDEMEILPDSVAESLEKDTEEEIISKLMEDKISYSEVAQLLGDICEENENDIEKEALSTNADDHALLFEKEFKIQQKYQLKRKSGERRRRRKLPDPALQGLMGEANLRFARRDYDEAIKMCMEIIRQYPNASGPYETLALIYEAKGMEDKHLQFLFITAFLANDALQWEKLSTTFLERGDTNQAIFCLTRAIALTPCNLEYHRERCSLYEKIGDKKRALKGYVYMLKFLQDDQGKEALNLAKVIAKIHFENGNHDLAQSAMEAAFKKYPAFVTAEEANLLLEVLMQRELFTEAVSVLMQYMKVELVCEEGKEAEFGALPAHEQITAESRLKIPPELAVDLKVKLAICCVRLKNFDTATRVASELLELSVDEYGDLYFDLAETFSKCNEPHLAIELLEALLASTLFGVAAVWLLYAQCLHSCGQLDHAISAYRKVIELAPGLGDTRVVLSGLLTELNRPDDAIQVLRQHEPSVLNQKLLYQSCQILLQQERWDEFLATATLLFNKHFLDIKTKEDMNIVLSVKKVSNKRDALMDVAKSRNKAKEEQESPEYTEDVIPLDDQWQLFNTVCNLLFKSNRFSELQRLTFCAMTSKPFMMDATKAKEVEFFALLACVHGERFDYAYSLIRDIIIRQPTSPRCWNILSYITSKANSSRQQKFLVRFARKFDYLLPLSILNGHNSLYTGFFNFSAIEYSHAWKMCPKDPFIAFMLGVINVNICSQKHTNNKNKLLLTATSFLNSYVELRGECQETLYNMGRAMHQLNILTQAILYYKKALNAPAVRCPENVETDLDLTRDIAYNLSLIYRKSGNLDLARHYIDKYVRFDR